MIKIGAGSLNEVFEELEREKGISKEVVISSLCDAMVAAYKKHMRRYSLSNELRRTNRRNRHFQRQNSC